MSDLISRKAVLDKLKDFSDMYTLEEQARTVLEAIVRIVTEQPTAYDVEKVEEELLNKRELYRIREIESLRKGEPLNIGVNLAKQESIEDCIEVVKRGRVE